MRATLSKSPDAFAVQRWTTGTLRLLTVAAGGVITVGGVQLLIQAGKAGTHFDRFVGEPASLRRPSLILAGAIHGDALSIVQLGILMLIATPVTRILCVGVQYTYEQDWLYVSVAILVLAVLAVSLFGH